MATKTLRFDMIESGVSFRMTDWTEAGKPVMTVYVKTSARKAARPEDICGTLRPVSEFAVKPSTNVTVEVPDPVPPTAEEVAADRLRHFNYRLEGLEAGAQADIDRFKKNLEQNPAYAFEWADAACRAAAHLDVAARVRGILEHPEGGMEKAMSLCLDQALQGARNQSHSTSALTNLMAAEKTAAYAELVVVRS